MILDKEDEPQPQPVQRVSRQSPESSMTSGPPSLERIRDLIAAGDTNGVMMAQTELLSSIFQMLRVQQENASLTRPPEDPVPPYSHPPFAPTPPSMPAIALPSISYLPSPPRTPSPTNIEEIESNSSHLPSLQESMAALNVSSSLVIDSSLGNDLEPGCLVSLANLKQTLVNHLSTLKVERLSRCQIEMLQAVREGTGAVVCAGASEGKTTGMLLSLLDSTRPSRSYPQVLILVASSAAVPSIAALLPSSFKIHIVAGDDVREDIRKINFGPHALVSTLPNLLEICKRKGLDLSGISWVGVDDASIWEETSAQRDWDRVSRASSLAPDARYLLLSSKPSLDPRVEAFASAFLGSAKRISARSSLSFLRSRTVRHIRVLTSTSQRLDSLLSLHSSLLASRPTIIFASTYTTVLSLSRSLDSRRVEVLTLNSEDSPAGCEVLFASGNGRKIVPLLTTTFACGHPTDRVEIVVFWDLPRDAEEYITRSRILDAHSEGQRLVFSFVSCPADKEQLQTLADRLEIDLEDAPSVFQSHMPALGP